MSLTWSLLKWAAKRVEPYAERFFDRLTERQRSADELEARRTLESWMHMARDPHVQMRQRWEAAGIERRLAWCIEANLGDGGHGDGYQHDSWWQLPQYARDALVAKHTR